MELNVDPYTAVLFWQVLFVLAAAGQLFFLLFISGRLAVHKPLSGAEALPAVSVVIAARNEYDNLRVNLPLILDQDYPDFEVVVVNHSSRDETDSLLKELQAKYPRLRISDIPVNERFDGGKKFAVTMGLKAARHERVVLTDADCRPSGKNWIRAMVAAAPSDEDIVLGYSPFLKSPGFLNTLIRFDGMSTALNYFGFALAGKPYMGVGRNLSYPRSLFFQVGGFRNHYGMASGDDDLLINQIAHKDNTAVCLSKEALMETIPEKTWKNYWRQKRRHLTTGARYRKIHKVLLLLQPLSLVLFWTAAIALLIHGIWVYAVLGVLLLRMSLQIAIFRRSSRWLGQKDLAFYAPALEIIALLFTACVHFANAATKQTKWKT
ncbi:MAG: glycosyltransferase [Cryomorphaceae bacterium]